MTPVTPATFLKALQASKAGDVLSLAPGAYGKPTVSGVRPGGPVTVVSADPGKPAVFGGLVVKNSAHLSFEGIEFAFAPVTTAAATNATGIMVSGSDDIWFRKCKFHGSADGKPGNDIVGVTFKSCSNYGIEDSDLSHHRVGVIQGGGFNATFTGNTFHDIRIDGIDSSTMDTVRIENNDFTNFRHLGTVGQGTGQKDGDHSDAIQFFTGGQTGASKNIAIRRNRIVQGDGAVMQGVWIQDESSVGPYENVTVEDNVIIGGNWNAIGVSNVKGLTLRNNTVAALAGAVSVDPVTNKAQPLVPYAQRLKACPGAIITGNTPVNKYGQTTLIVSDGGAALLK